MNKSVGNGFTYSTMLVTGGAGFVGSSLAIGFKEKYPSLAVIVIDNLKRRGSELNIRRLRETGVEFYHGDIRNPEDLDIGRPFDILIDCSAEPSVLAGYTQGPYYLIQTNLSGTINCLELARKNKADIVFLSTSRVYPYKALNEIKVTETSSRYVWDENQDVHSIRGWSTRGITTDFALSGPKSLYGATKLCSELIIEEYADMFGLKAVINRCGVIAGPWQFGKVDQGVFTLWMLAHYFKKELSYIGFSSPGKQVRDLLHIQDLFALIEAQVLSLSTGCKTFNVGGGYDISLSLLETTNLCEEITGNHIDIRSDQNTREADVIIYITDNKRVSDNYGWHPNRTGKQILADIFDWIKVNEAELSFLKSTS